MSLMPAHTNKCAFGWTSSVVTFKAAKQKNRPSLDGRLHEHPESSGCTEGLFHDKRGRTARHQ